jgi:hypothetical protein
MSPDSAQAASTVMPKILIQGLPKYMQQSPSTVVLQYFWGDTADSNELKTAFSIAFVLLILLFGFLDRKRSVQNSDAVIAVIVIIVYLILGISYFQQVIIQVHPLWLVIALWVTTFGFLCLLIGAIVSGAFDLTPASMVFGAVAITGGILLNNLGAYQTIFKIPSNLLFTFDSMIQLSKIQMFWTMGAFTVLVYGHFIVAILCSFSEIVRPAKKGIKITSKNFRSFFFSIIVLGLFILLRSITLPAGKWYSFLSQPNPIILALLILVGDVIFANIKNEQMDGSGVNYTQLKLGTLTISSPYDVIIFQLILGAFLMVIFGKV